MGNNWKSKAFSTCLLVLVWVVGAIRMEEEMTTHSSILAWRIPWTEESGGLQTPDGGNKTSDVTDVT